MRTEPGTEYSTDRGQQQGEKRQNLKRKIIEMKIVAQREEIMRGRRNLQRCVTLLATRRLVPTRRVNYGLAFS